MKIKVDNKLIVALKSCCKRHKVCILNTSEQLSNKIDSLISGYIYDVNHAKDVEEAVKDDNYTDSIYYRTTNLEGEM